jgi:hypothetical protein
MKLSIVTYLIGATVLLVVVFMTSRLGLPISSRVLPPLALAGLLSAGVGVNIVQSFAAYLRAFKSEPMMAMSVSCSLLSGTGVFLFGSSTGATAASWWYCSVSILGVVWLFNILKKSRSEWCRNE